MRWLSLAGAIALALVVTVGLLEVLVLACDRWMNGDRWVNGGGRGEGKKKGAAEEADGFLDGRDV